jgi:hypothetical protein
LKPRNKSQRPLADRFQFCEKRRRIARRDVERFAARVDAQHFAGPALVENFEKASEVLGVRLHL